MIKMDLRKNNGQIYDMAAGVPSKTGDTEISCDRNRADAS
jgi:hypothetical protein